MGFVRFLLLTVSMERGTVVLTLLMSKVGLKAPAPATLLPAGRTRSHTPAHWLRTDGALRSLRC